MAGQLVLILWTVGASMQPSPARAQDGMTLGPGKRVRVLDRSLGHEPVMGRIDALSGDTLMLKPDFDRFHARQVVLDRDSRVDISIAHHNYAGRGLLIGGAIGLAFGAFAVGFQKSLNDLGSSSDPQSQKKVSNGPIVAAAAIGAGVGAVVGSSITTDSWVTVRSPSVSMGGSWGRDGQMRLAMTVAF